MNYLAQIAESAAAICIVTSNDDVLLNIPIKFTQQDDGSYCTQPIDEFVERTGFADHIKFLDAQGAMLVTLPIGSTFRLIVDDVPCNLIVNGMHIIFNDGIRLCAEQPEMDVRDRGFGRRE